MVVPNTEAGCFWMYEQRLLELPSVWVGINTLWAVDMCIWAKSFQIPPCVVSSLHFLLFHLCWLQNWFILFSAGLFFCLSASSSLLLPAPSCLWGSLSSACGGRGGDTSPTAEQLNSQKSGEVVCVSQHPCEIPKGGVSILWIVPHRNSLRFNSALQLMCYECASSWGASAAAGAKFFRPLLNYGHQRLKAIGFYSTRTFLVQAFMQGWSWKG